MSLQVNPLHPIHYQKPLEVYHRLPHPHHVRMIPGEGELNHKVAPPTPALLLKVSFLREFLLKTQPL